MIQDQATPLAISNGKYTSQNRLSPDAGKVVQALNDIATSQGADTSLHLHNLTTLVHQLATSDSATFTRLSDLIKRYDKNDILVSPKEATTAFKILFSGLTANNFATQIKDNLDKIDAQRKTTPSDDFTVNIQLTRNTSPTGYAPAASERTGITITLVNPALSASPRETFGSGKGNHQQPPAMMQAPPPPPSAPPMQAQQGPPPMTAKNAEAAASSDTSVYYTYDTSTGTFIKKSSTTGMVV